MLCSNVETGIGCIASSVPALRILINREHNNSSDLSNKRSAPQRSSNHFTRGTQPRRGINNGGFSPACPHHKGSDSWERLHDGASDRSEACDAIGDLPQDELSAFHFELRGLKQEQSIYHTGVSEARL